jgi:hypothetical protein
MPKFEPKYIPCEHEPDHPSFDESLIRACKGTNLMECVKCYTLFN